MTISKKQRMLHLIEQLQSISTELPETVNDKLQKAHNQLNDMSEGDVEQHTDKVVSSQASVLGVDLSTPENLLHSTYDDLEQLSKKEEAPQKLQEALKEMRYYFTIEEDEGFFP